MAKKTIIDTDLTETSVEVPSVEKVPEIKLPEINKAIFETVKLKEDIDRLFIGGVVYTFKENEVRQVPKHVADILRADGVAI